MPTRQISGFSHKFGDHINTDYIISGRYKFSTLDMNELAKHIMEDLDKHFYEKIKPGDMIVAGENFGCGSSREQATLAIKHAQISAVLAKSFARIFYRNAINGGLVVIECDTDKIEDGDQLAIDLEKGMINNLTKNIEVKSQPLPLAMIKILSEGGLVAYFKKYKTFEVK